MLTISFYEIYLVLLYTQNARYISLNYSFRRTIKSKKSQKNVVLNLSVGRITTSYLNHIIIIY